MSSILYQVQEGGLSILCQGNIKDFFHFLFYGHFMGKTHTNLVCIIVAKTFDKGGGGSPIFYMKKMGAVHEH